MRREQFQPSTSLAITFYSSRLRDLITTTPLNKNVTFDPLLLRAQDISMFNDKTLAWLARAGGGIVETGEQDEGIDHDTTPRWQAYSEHSGTSEEEERVRTGRDRRLRASAPSKIRWLALSQREMLEISPPVTHGGMNTQQGLHGLGLTFPEKDSSIPGLLPDAVLDKWDQSSTFLKSRRSGQISPRYIPSQRSSKQPKFRLVIDPPEGQKLEA